MKPFSSLSDNSSSASVSGLEENISAAKNPKLIMLITAVDSHTSLLLHKMLSENCQHWYRHAVYLPSMSSTAITCDFLNGDLEINLTAQIF